MSTSDREPAGAQPSTWTMSRTNTVLVTACVLGALICFVLGQVMFAITLLCGAVGGGVGAVLARRRGASDLERVNALEYADERDRAAGVKGLAAVGAVALMLSIAQLVLHSILPTDPISRWSSAALFFALVISWFLANWFFVRRS